MQLKNIKDKRSTTEKDIEQYLCRKIKALHGIAYKFSSPARRSVPDRLCVMPKGILAFIEVKRPGQKPTAAQLREIQLLQSMGYLANYVDSYEAIDLVIKNLKEEIFNA